MPLFVPETDGVLIHHFRNRNRYFTVVQRYVIQIAILGRILCLSQKGKTRDVGDSIILIRQRKLIRYRNPISRRSGNAFLGVQSFIGIIRSAFRITVIIDPSGPCIFSAPSGT